MSAYWISIYREITDEAKLAAYAELAGKTAFSAREAMVGLLRESGDLDGEPSEDDVLGVDDVPLAGDVGGLGGERTH